MKKLDRVKPGKSAIPVLLEELRALRGSFGVDAQRRKSALLGALTKARIVRGEQLLRLHDELLFMAAFPDTEKLRGTAENVLSKYRSRVARLGARERTALGDNGIAGTIVVHTFLYGTAVWLLEQNQCVTIDWKHTDDPGRLDLLLRQTLLSIEVEAFDSDECSTEEWVSLASGQGGGNILRWLLGDCAGEDLRLLHSLYDDADLALGWELGDSRWSASRNRAPVDRIVVRRAFRTAPTDISANVTKPLRGLKPVARAGAKPWRDSSIAALAARGREVAPTVSANLDEIYVVSLGDGVDLCVLGLPPEDRLPLEANYGYVMFSNGIAIGYGGVTALAGQANTGINIFESFRRSEAAFLFAESLRVFRALFGVTRFIVNPYQLGADNDEALESGSYWFYHRLGFRSRDPAIRALADKECARIVQSSGRRSPLSVLRRLASADVVLELPGAEGTPLFEERWLLVLGRAVARHFAAISLGARRAHLAQLSRELCVTLTGHRRPLGAVEKRGAEHLVPIIALMRDEIVSWPSAERSALWELVRLKGGKQERAFARSSRAHVRWWNAVAELCGRLEQNS